MFQPLLPWIYQCQCWLFLYELFPKAGLGQPNPKQLHQTYGVSGIHCQQRHVLPPRISNKELTNKVWNQNHPKPTTPARWVKWLSKWVTWGITLLVRIITPYLKLKTSRGPLCVTKTLDTVFTVHPHLLQNFLGCFSDQQKTSPPTPTPPGCARWRNPSLWLQWPPDFNERGTNVVVVAEDFPRRIRECMVFVYLDELWMFHGFQCIGKYVIQKMWCSWIMCFFAPQVTDCRKAVVVVPYGFQWWCMFFSHCSLC